MPQLLLLPDPRPLVERLGPEFFRQMSEKPGVYLMRDVADQVLYVGKAKNLRKRLGSYRVANPDRLRRRHLVLLRKVARIEVEECSDEAAALCREAELLRTLRPRFNRAGTWPGTPRFLSWRTTNNGLDLAMTLTADPGWMSEDASDGACQPDNAAFSLVGIPTDKHAQSAPWTAHTSAGELGVKRTAICARRPWGGVYGPMGAGVIPLRTALVRLLWCAIHPQHGLVRMPGGWFHGQLRDVVTIPRMQASPEVIEEAERRLQALFGSDWLGFSDWICTRMPSQRTYEIAARDADLETVMKTLKIS